MYVTLLHIMMPKVHQCPVSYHPFTKDAPSNVAIEGFDWQALTRCMVSN